MIRRLTLLLGLTAVAPCAALAEVTVPLPTGAEQTADEGGARASYALAVGPWDGKGTATVALTGAVRSRAWRLPGGGGSTLALTDSTAKGLKDQGFAPIYACDTDRCGGFDFRYALPLLPEPLMHVDLGDFRYVALVRGQGPEADYAALTVSHAGDTGFVQLTTIDHGAPLSETEDSAVPVSPLPEVEPLAPAAPAKDFNTAGRMVMDDLRFASGATELGPGPFASLDRLAALLRADPAASVAIVGHTDASGPLAVNITLSRARAQSVRARLVQDYGIPPAQVAAEGVGYLAPLADNRTEEGRQKNRRVEAVLTSTR